MSKKKISRSKYLPYDVPAPGQPIITVDHVSMMFNMASEQLNSLKEYFIKIMKHQLFFKKFMALEDITFTVNRGDVYGIVGTNGSGKSTMLKIIAGVLEPSEGMVTVRGTIAPLIELGAGFDMELTARENIYLNGALLGYSKKFISDRFEEIVDFAEVRDFLDMPMKNYSSGMVARVAFAVATATIPDILVVDEALSVGDFRFQEKCEKRIQDLVTNHGTTLLFVSHSIDQVERVCEKCLWIERGHLRMKGDVEKVCEYYRHMDEPGWTYDPEKVREERIEQAEQQQDKFFDADNKKAEENSASDVNTHADDAVSADAPVDNSGDTSQAAEKVVEDAK